MQLTFLKVEAYDHIQTNHLPKRKSISRIILFHFKQGVNSGKPLLTPCPNCFVCLCENEKDKEELYWLLFGMWQGKAIRPHLIGSVIPFIRLRELTDLIKIGVEKLTINPEKVRKNIYKIVQMEKHQINIQKQIDLIKQMKRALIFEVLQ